MRPVGFRQVIVGGGLGLALGLVAGAPAWGADEGTVPGAAPDARVTNDVHLFVHSDGVVSAQEEIRFGEAAPEEFVRSFVVREGHDVATDRVYEISRLQAADGEGGAVAFETAEDDHLLEVRLETGDVESLVLTYDFRGATTDLGDRVDLDWTAVGGYSMPVAETEVVVDSAHPPDGLMCVVGDSRSATLCTASDMGGHEGTHARFMQAHLDPGEKLWIRVSYPPGAAAGNPIEERRFSVTSAFQVTPGTAGVFGLVLVVLVGGLALLAHLRGRDERTVRAEIQEGDHVPLAAWGGDLRFHPPDGVLPGQIGTLLDEQVDVVDITATVVDLAVRGYYRIEELSSMESHEHHTSIDWRLRRHPVPPVGDVLQDYERELLHALFDRRDEVLVSELGEDFAQQLTRVRETLYAQMVELGWFARGPNTVRNRWSSAGIAITVGGVALTVLLAMFTTLAFTGLAVVIAGAAITVGAQYMPAKTAHGSRVFAHTLGFRRYMKRGSAHDVPEGVERVALFSRYLPYAVIFDKMESWAGILAEELANEDLPWYDAPDTWGRDDFAGSIKTFVLTFSGVVSSTRPFRTMV